MAPFQFVRQFSTFGEPVDEQINQVLAGWPGFRVAAVYSITVDIIRRAPEHQVIVVFEFREAR